MNCVHILTRGINKDKQCSRLGKHEGYCKQHYDLINRLNLVKERAETELAEFIGGQDVQPVMYDEDRINKSIFMITINTNKRVEDLQDYQKERFKAMMIHLFDDKNIFDFIQRPDKDGIDEDDFDIIQIKLGYNFEVGSAKRCLHAHATIEIDHKTILRLNIPELRSLINRVVDSPCYLDVRTPRQVTSATWNKYINKMYLD